MLGPGTGKGAKGKGVKPSPTPTRVSPALLSDRSTKTKIRFIGRSPKGIPIYQFSYRNQPNKRYQGTIAQEIIQARPDAVVRRDGLMFVDYSRLDVVMRELP